MADLKPDTSSRQIVCQILGHQPRLYGSLFNFNRDEKSKRARASGVRCARCLQFMRWDPKTLQIVLYRV